MIVHKRTVTPFFRSFIAETYPGLKNNPAFWGLITYLMFSTRRDEITGRLILDSETLAEIEGKHHQLRAKNYKSEPFLQAFKYNVQDFEWTNWDSTKKIARVVKKLEWPQEVEEALREEINTVAKPTERVYLVDGTKFNSESQKKIREQTRADVMEQLAKTVPVASKLINYLNSQSVRTFNPILLNINDALDMARNLSKDSENQLKILGSILDQIVPIYRSTENSVRVFALGESIPNLQRDVRKALTQNWTEFDLKSAQLAICAKIWDVPIVQEFLSSGGSIWKHLHDHFQIRQTPETKGIFKTALYTTMYGGGRKRISKQLEDLTIENAVDIFLSNPLIKAMWNARRKQMVMIRSEKGGYNYFGEFLSIDYSKTRAEVDHRVRSILAQQAQSYELALLSPVIDYAIDQETKRHGFIITLWQHDGFSVAFKSDAMKEQHIWNMEYMVKNKANELGIITKLEVA